MNSNKCSNIITNCKKKFRIRKNYIMVFYLLGCTSLFLFSDIIQKSKLTSNYKQKRYINCIKILSHNSNLVTQDIDLICQNFHHITNFDKFIHNLVFTWFIIYTTMREIIGFNIFPFWYWAVAHFSILIFSLLGEVEELKFSIDTDENWDNTQVAIIIFTGLLLFYLTVRQIYMRSINYISILKILLSNLLINFLYLSTSKSITYHLHHSFLCGVLSYCFCDFNSKFNLLIHSIMIGIMIQGINYYDIFGIIIFSTKDLVNFPDLNFSVICFSIVAVIGLLGGLLNKYYCIDEIAESDDDDLELPFL